MNDLNKNILPVITLYQPWATWIMRGWKLIETRTHNHLQSLLNKTVLIHAGKTTDNSFYAVNNPYLTKEQLLHKPEEMVNGFILGSAFVFSTRRLNRDDNSLALIECGGDVMRFGLFLQDIKVFQEPIPCRGDMGIWYYDMDAMQKVPKPLDNSQPTLFK